MLLMDNIILIKKMGKSFSKMTISKDSSYFVPWFWFGLYQQTTPI